MTGRGRQRRGVLMIQMLITIVLISAFVIVADRVFRLSLLTTAKVSADEEESIRLERALGALRADVWGASAVKIVTPSRLSIDDRVVWEVDPEGELLRREGGAARRFGPLRLTFEARPPLVGVSMGGREVAVLRQALGGGLK